MRWSRCRSLSTQPQDSLRTELDPFWRLYRTPRTDTWWLPLQCFQWTFVPLQTPSSSRSRLGSCCKGDNCGCSLLSSHLSTSPGTHSPQCWIVSLHSYSNLSLFLKCWFLCSTLDLFPGNSTQSPSPELKMKEAVAGSPSTNSCLQCLLLNPLSSFTPHPPSLELLAPAKSRLSCTRQTDRTHAFWVFLLDAEWSDFYNW